LLSPVALALTWWLRRAKTALAAHGYLAAQAKRGVDARDAAARVAELAPDGVVVDTDDLPSWPMPLIMLLGVAGLVSAIVALVHVL
jgi:hypothetical protein